MRLRYTTLLLLLMLCAGCRTKYFEKRVVEPPVLYEVCSRCGAARAWGSDYVAEMPSACADKKCAFQETTKVELVRKGYQVRANWKISRDGKLTSKRERGPIEKP